MAGAAQNACVYRDKDCTQPISLSEIDEMFTSRSLIVYVEKTDGDGNIEKYYSLVTSVFHKYINGKECGNLAASTPGMHLYTSEFFTS